MKYTAPILIIILIAPLAGLLIPFVEADIIFTAIPPENHHIPDLQDGNATGSHYHMAGWWDADGHLGVNQTRVHVSFPNTDPSVIQENNQLHAGMFVQGCDSVRHQIDYAYYTTLSLDHDGNLYFNKGIFQTYEALPHWEHPYPEGPLPWKKLLYHSSYLIEGASLSDIAVLTARWDPPSGTIYWTCHISGFVPFTVGYEIASHPECPTIQRQFIVGDYHMTLDQKLMCWWAGPYYMVYFFQFGIHSKYNIGQGGWNAKVEHPQYYNENSWWPVNKAKSIGGAKAFMDLRYTWGGKTYDGVNADYHEKDPAIDRRRIKFYYSGSTLNHHTLLWQPPSYPGGGGGCPFVYTWNGTQHAIDNNILGDSESSDGADVEDHYRLEQPLVVNDGKYSLLIREFEQEHSYLEQVKLLAVNHESDVNIAVSPSGEILTYKEPTPPISAFDNYGNNQLDLLEVADGDYYESQPGDRVILDFGDLNIADGAKLVMWADAEFKEVKSCVHVQVWNASGSWENIAVIRTRVYWAIEIVDLLEYLPDANGELKVRLFFTAEHKIDYVGLDTTKEDDFTVDYGNLVSAIHSETGSVKTELLESDSIYAEIVPDQQIELEFTLSENVKDKRAYIIYVKGHYYTIT